MNTSLLTFRNNIFKFTLLSIFYVFLIVKSSCAEYLGLTSNISQYNITWYFDREYEYGTFANGDYWVKGPVNITKITPDSEYNFVTNGENNTICIGESKGLNNCNLWCNENAPEGFSSYCIGSERGYGICYCVRMRNGWESNPEPLGGQAFDDRASSFYPKMPNLPYIALPNESIVKTVSVDMNATSCMPCINKAAVLTVVYEIPPDNGTIVFRPPYVGKSKPYYYVTDMKTHILPSLKPVKNTPSLEWVYERFKKVQLDHGQGLTGRSLHPVEHMPNYGADIARDNGDAVLRLMLNDTIEEKMSALIAYVQYGIDLYHMVIYNHTWPDGGGHRPGQRIVLAFAAAILDNDKMKNISRNIDFFEEDRGVYTGTEGRVLYGYTHHNDEYRYWNVIVDYNAGYRAYPDPYGFIDGGPAPGTSYQSCCTSNTYKGQVLAMHLMPSIREAWNDTEIINYTERWIEFGAWSQPDPCAPADGICVNGTNNGTRCTTANKSICGTGYCDLKANWPKNYGVTYGPDGNGSCIKDTDPSDGIGRFPFLHGTNKDGVEGARYSTFQAEMWNAYWNTTNIKCVHKAEIYPCNGCIDITELISFIDRWKFSNIDITIKELIEAIGLWKKGC